MEKGILVCKNYFFPANTVPVESLDGIYEGNDSSLIKLFQPQFEIQKRISNEYFTKHSQLSTVLNLTIAVLELDPGKDKKRFVFVNYGDNKGLFITRSKKKDSFLVIDNTGTKNKTFSWTECSQFILQKVGNCPTFQVTEYIALPATKEQIMTQEKEPKQKTKKRKTRKSTTTTTKVSKSSSSSSLKNDTRGEEEEEMVEAPSSINVNELNLENNNDPTPMITESFPSSSNNEGGGEEKKEEEEEQENTETSPSVAVVKKRKKVSSRTTSFRKRKKTEE